MCDNTPTFSCNDCIAVFDTPNQLSTHHRQLHQSTTIVTYKDAEAPLKIHRQDYDNKFHCNCGYASANSKLFWKHAQKHQYIEEDNDVDDANDIAIDPALLSSEVGILSSAMEEQSVSINNITDRADNTPWMSRTRWLHIFKNVDLEHITTVASSKPEDNIMQQIVVGIQQYFDVCSEDIKKSSHLMLRWLGEYIIQH